MPDDFSFGDPELDAMMGTASTESGQSAPAPVAPSAPANPAVAPAQSGVKWGKREFPSVDEAGKAYLNMEKMYGQLQNQHKAIAPWAKVKSYADQHPKFRQALLKAYEDNEREVRGQRNPDAGQPRLDPVFEERIKRLEAARDDAELRSEMSAVRSKYKLDDASMRKVLEYSEKNGGIDLDLAFKGFAHDTGWKNPSAKAADVAVAKAASAQIGTAPDVMPSAKKSLVNDDKAWKAEAFKALDGYGIKD